MIYNIIIIFDWPFRSYSHRCLYNNNVLIFILERSMCSRLLWWNFLVRKIPSNVVLLFKVTGANKGIGLSTVKSLCQKLGPDAVVYLTARSVERGTQAVKELEGQGLKPKFHPLDVEDKKTIDIFAEYLKKEHGGLDVLVNNAGILFRVSYN